MSRILVVEDEQAIAEALIFNLERKGYHVDYADDGAKALGLVRSSQFDLILLDIRLPEIDGLEVCQRLRAAQNYVPVIMLTARDKKEDIIQGLKSGADDYLTKPFDLDELFTRIEVLLRRTRQWQTQESSALPSQWQFDQFSIDFTTWEARTLRGDVILSRKEIEILKIFFHKKGQVISREELLDKVWGLPNHPNTRIVDNVIVSLRKYFETDSHNPKHILNMRGMGYKFVE